MPGIGGTSFEQTRAEQIATQLDSSFWDIEALDGPRSPSPPPIYDSNGQRTNTREVQTHPMIFLMFSPHKFYD